MIMNWNPAVNSKFSLEGEFGLEDGYVEELEFESGKKRTYLKNSYVPTIYSLSLALDNKERTKTGKTEFEEFRDWFNKTLRYGILPFTVTRIGYKRKVWYIKNDETGIYYFLPGSLRYDDFDNIVIANFSVRETGTTPETEHTFLATEEGQILFVGNFTYIVI